MRAVPWTQRSHDLQAQLWLRTCPWAAKPCLQPTLLAASHRTGPDTRLFSHAEHTCSPRGLSQDNGIKCSIGWGGKNMKQARNKSLKATQTACPDAAGVCHTNRTLNLSGVPLPHILRTHTCCTPQCKGGGEEGKGQGSPQVPTARATEKLRTLPEALPQAETCGPCRGPSMYTGCVLPSWAWEKSAQSNA